LAALLLLLPGLSAAAADPSWMTESAMRSAFIGKTLDGHYGNGLEWSETYNDNGRLEYSEKWRGGGGNWYFRDRVFCTFYDPGKGLSGGCFTALQSGANCFEFYLAEFSEREADKTVPPGPVGRWVARAWRRGEPSTCEAKPTV
jgi:hypothetical protein